MDSKKEEEWFGTELLLAGGLAVIILGGMGWVWHVNKAQ